MMVTLVVAVPSTASAWDSLRHDKCIVRAHAYAADDHPNLSPQEAQERTDWLYSQCAENDAVEAFAEEQGSMAPALFPNKEDDRHAHPLHCMSLSDNRFGMHTNHNSPNPPPDPNGPGGAAAVNVPGEFMYAFINGKARFMMRYVVWTIDDRNGDPVTPVKINQHPTYQGTPQVTVALLNFSQAYQPVSVWVEMPDNMAVANIESSGVLPGRRLTMRTWMESKCHDKRDPMVIPHMLINHMQSLGWLDSGASAQSPRAVRFVSNGDPNQASSWSLTEVPVTLPPSNQIFTKNSYKWFYDSGVVYNGSDTLGPSLSTDHSPGETFPGPSVTLSGAATDSTAVDAVRVTIRNSAGEYLQDNGSFAASTNELDTTLAAPGSTSTSWSITATLPNGAFDLDVIGEDSLGNTSLLTNADFVVDPNGPDTTPPTVDMDHAIDTQFVGPQVTIAGTANDNVGVTAITVEIKNRDTKLFLQPDGSFGSRVALPAVLDSPGGQSSTWSITVNLPSGPYNIESFAYDLAGNEGENPTWKKFDVIDPPSDGLDPTVTTDHPAGFEFDTDPVTLTGDASDNVGVTEVVARIANSTGDFLQADGSFASTPADIATVLGSPGATTTSWGLDVSLPNDSYSLEVVARDAAGNEGTDSSGGFTVNVADVTAPSVTTNHSNGASFSGPNVTLSGTASDAVGVESVAVTVVNSSGDFLQPGGSFAASPAELDTQLTNQGATTTDWSITVSLPDDAYDLEVYARDAAANEGVAANADFTVTAPDTEDPSVTVDHAPGNEFDALPVVLSGTASDNVGVAEVALTIRNAAGDYLQSDGTFATPIFEHSSTLGSPNGTATTWSLSITVPNGSYDLDATARDAAGNAATEPNADFSVAVVDNNDPTVDVDHAPGTQFTANPVPLSGTAGDNVGVSAVVVTVANSSGDFLQPDGSFDPTYAELTTNLAAPGALNTTWSIDVVLPDGAYDLEVMARDAAGNESVESAADFTVATVADTTRPTANVNHAANTVFTGPDVTLNGVANDNVGVVSVSIKVKDRDTGLWLQSNGSFAPGVVWHTATVANPGATSVTWSIDISLPNGRYNPVSRAFDAAGNEGTQTTFRPIEVTSGGGGGPPDTSAPTTNVDHPRDEVMNGPDITITGVADDNVGVTSVRVKVKDRDSGLWLQEDGSFASGVFWHDAIVNNPGATSATWTIEFTLPNGRYNPVSEAYDAAGNRGTQTAFRPFEVV